MIIIAFLYVLMFPRNGLELSGVGSNLQISEFAEPASAPASGYAARYINSVPEQNMLCPPTEWY
jgi:hypothetical protein